MDNVTQDEDATEEKNTEIHTYLNSFKEEILSGEDETEKIHDESADYEHEPKKLKISQDVLMYLTSTDGTFYTTNAVQNGQPQPVTLIANDEQNEGEASTDGLQHVVVTLGESGNFVLSDAKTVSYALSTPIRQGSVLKNNHNSTADILRPSNVMVVQADDDIDQENVIPLKNNVSNESSNAGTELQDNFHQIYQLISTGTEQALVKNAAIVTGDAPPLIQGNPYQTVTVVPSDTNPGQLNYVLFVSPMEEPDRKSGANGAKLLAVDGEIRDEKAKVFKAASDRVVGSYTCQYCDYSSNKRYLLSRHMKCHSDERPHKCKVCERGFKTLASLQNHVNTHTKTRPHACKECESTFTTSGELVRHMRYKHTHERPHRCTECDYASVELSKLKRHMRCHTGERPYQCPHCTYASPDTYKLKRHLRTHTGEKPYACDVCQARFTQSNSLKSHLLIHSGNKPAYQCTYCPATCGRKTDLRIHIQKLHSPDKQQKCKRCGEVFKDKYSFKVHCKTHDGEKSFKCDECPFVTISPQQFEAHIQLHGNDNFYQCTKCNDSFDDPQLLTQHIDLQHDPNYDPTAKNKAIECPDCGKMFRHHQNMIRHSSIHDPEASSEKREEAMQIGRPKEPGEIKDGEESDEMDNEDNFENEQGLFELIQLPKYAEDGNKVVSTASGPFLTVTENNGEYTVVSHSSSKNIQTVISSFTEGAEINGEYQAPLRIEFEGESSESELNDNYQQESHTNNNNQNQYSSKKSPQIVQIVAQNQQIPVTSSNSLESMNQNR